MNNEVLNHTDIPLGESFLLVNENVTGMEVKDGKVSAGCWLRISEENGQILSEEKDLFAGNDIFKKDEATRLKCTINTGKPMEWEKKYKVQVVFWDKYGNGKITNECTIMSIDIPWSTEGNSCSLKTFNEQRLRMEPCSLNRLCYQATLLLPYLLHFFNPITTVFKGNKTFTIFYYRLVGHSTISPHLNSVE